MSEKEVFLREQYIPLLAKLKPSQQGNWGVLSAQGMVEHMSDSVGIAYGRITQPLHTPPGMVDKMRAFALSDKTFKENTKNAYMAEEPAPLRFSSMQDALAELDTEIKAFMEFYSKNPGHKQLNPFFGEFTYEEWVHLLHKHAFHHLKQFNLA